MTCAEYLNETFLPWTTILEPNRTEVCFPWFELDARNAITTLHPCKRLPPHGERKRMVSGEATASYLAEADPRELVASLPEARFVVLLRDPASRALSHFKMLQRFGDLSGRDFDDFVSSSTVSLQTCLASLPSSLSTSLDAQCACILDRSQSLVGLGVYFCSLRRWEPYLDKILIVSTERLARDPQTVINDVVRHLGLREVDISTFPSLVQRFNVVKADAADDGDEAVERGLAALRSFYSPWNRQLRAFLGDSLDADLSSLTA